MGAAACPGPELGAAEGPLRGDTSGGSRSREGRAGGTPGPLPDSGGCPGAAPRPRCPSLLQVAADSARRPPGGRPGAGGAAPAPGPPRDPRCRCRARLGQAVTAAAAPPPCTDCI